MLGWPLCTRPTCHAPHTALTTADCSAECGRHSKATVITAAGDQRDTTCKLLLRSYAAGRSSSLLCRRLACASRHKLSLPGTLEETWHRVALLHADAP